MDGNIIQDSSILKRPSLGEEGDCGSGVGCVCVKCLVGGGWVFAVGGVDLLLWLGLGGGTEPPLVWFVGGGWFLEFLMALPPFFLALLLVSFFFFFFFWGCLCLSGGFFWKGIVSLGRESLDLFSFSRLFSVPDSARFQFFRKTFCL